MFCLCFAFYRSSGLLPQSKEVTVDTLGVCLWLRDLVPGFTARSL